MKIQKDGNQRKCLPIIKDQAVTKRKNFEKGMIIEKDLRKECGKRSPERPRSMLLERLIARLK